MFTKPYFIIVDDETDLLNNLVRIFEDNSFDNIFDIRARQSGEDAIVLAKKIKNLGGDVAVLLTDMVMPGLQGFDVIEAFKKHFDHFIPIINTAYADKESAIRAINKGGVKAYFEKPWQAIDEEIIPKIKRLCKIYFSSSENDVHFTFRKLKKIDREFEEYFTCRYLSWFQEGWKEKNKKWIDIDEFDFFSEFLCGFENRIEAEYLAGGLRKIYPEYRHENKFIIERIIDRNKYYFGDSDKRKQLRPERIEVIEKHDVSFFTEAVNKLIKIADLPKNLIKNIRGLLENNKIVFDEKSNILQKYSISKKYKKFIYPCQIHHDSNSSITKFLEKLNHNISNCPVIEIGRLSVHGRYRGKFFGNQFYMRLQEEVFADGIAMNEKHGLICCAPSHYKHFYKSLGFTPVPGAKPVYYPDSDVPSMVYYIDIDALIDSQMMVLRPDRKDRIIQLAEKIKKINNGDKYYVSCSCKNMEKCLGLDYDMPYNEPVNYHCPLRAKGFLND
jgi:CheY-like chemotaxis protein